MNDIWLPPGVIEGPADGTPAWKDFRRGKVTASNFIKVTSEPRTKADKAAGKMTDGAKGYLSQIVAATILGYDPPTMSTDDMDRGVDKQSDAADRYESKRFVEVKKGRILQVQGTLICATPDGFVEEDEEGPGLLEIKCPKENTHMGTYLFREVPDKYLDQIQGQMWVSGRSWCDFVSFDDRFPLPMQMVVIRVHADEDQQRLFLEKVRNFEDMVTSRVSEIRAYLHSCGHEEAQVINKALEDSLSGDTLADLG